MKAAERDLLLRTLQSRFEQHAHRHPGIAWAEVRARLDAHSDALVVLQRMEATGGEPDVIGRYGASGAVTYCDRRYGQVFVYHNGAPCYYAARGFRGALRV